MFTSTIDEISVHIRKGLFSLLIKNLDKLISVHNIIFSETFGVQTWLTLDG